MIIQIKLFVVWTENEFKFGNLNPFVWINQPWGSLLSDKEPIDDLNSEEPKEHV